MSIEMIQTTTRFLCTAVLAGALIGTAASRATAQSSSGTDQTGGSSGAAAAGAALGAMSGATFAAIGSVFPCTQTYAGASCVRTSTIIGTVVGLGSGMAMGATNQEIVEDMATGAAIGFVIGGGIGLAMKQVILYSTWGDVMMSGFVGAAVGTSPKGALIGLGAGTLVGLVAWQVSSSFDLVNAAEFSLGGLAVGGIASLVYRAFDSQSSGDDSIMTLPIQIRF